jgi:pilus assembly protein CpaF
MEWFRRGSTSSDGSSDPADEDTQILAESPPTEMSANEVQYQTLKREVHHALISTIDMTVMESMSDDELLYEIRKKAQDLSHGISHSLSKDDRERLVQEVLDETFGYGPLEPLMRDYSISDILINGPRQVYIERNGRLNTTKVTFYDEAHLLQILQRIVANAGRRIDESSPMVDARLPDGSRLNAIIKPLALNGPLVSIRRFGARPLMAKDLLANDSLTQDMLTFLAACVQARVNIAISGGTGTGKTTLLNCLSSFIPKGERVATIEDAAELVLQQPHVAKMETRPPNLEGEGAVGMRELVRNALRMRPDRIIVGECRGAEALDMLEAMNTGHEGSLTTVHANSPRDAITRLEMMIGRSGFEMPIWVIRRQIASSIDIIVQVARLMGGARKIVRISEIAGLEGDTVMMHDLFEYVQTGVDAEQKSVGYFQANGVRPECLDKLIASGIQVSPAIFDPPE